MSELLLAATAAALERLTEVMDGGIRNLIINIPPRHLKSFIASICYPGRVSMTGPV